MNNVYKSGEYYWDINSFNAIGEPKKDIVPNKFSFRVYVCGQWMDSETFETYEDAEREQKNLLERWFALKNGKENIEQSIKAYEQNI